MRYTNLRFTYLILLGRDYLLTW